MIIFIVQKTCEDNMPMAMSGGEGRCPTGAELPVAVAAYSSATVKNATTTDTRYRERLLVVPSGTQTKAWP